MANNALALYGGWLPDIAIYNSFIAQCLGVVHGPIQNPAVIQFQNDINNNIQMRNLFDKIFQQVPNNDQVHSFDNLLRLLDYIVQRPPAFHTAGGTSQPIGVPIYLILDLLSNTSAAYDLFRMPEFNDAMRKLLNSWFQYLTSPASNSTLTDNNDGWFSQAGINALQSENRGIFNDTYICPNPAAVNRGFYSWDAFFTREVKPGARPVHPGDNPGWIRNACESRGYRIARDVQAHDRFWIKGQGYSLFDMLRGNDFAQSFVGGTVYQAFLSPFDYHRWRSPVRGTIFKIISVPGTYYAVLPDAEDRGALIRSQDWLTVSSSRALIYIQADNPTIGLVCFIAVGMAEVSSCEVTVKEGQQVNVGDQLGLFRFGGSSYALIFGPQIKVTFVDKPNEEPPSPSGLLGGGDGNVIGRHIRVNTFLAYASPS